MASRVTEEEIYSIIGRYIHYDYKMCDLVMDIINRMDGDYSNDNVYQAIDNGIIYYHQQWTILEHYCNPQDANWNIAFEDFLNDICGIVAAVQDLEDKCISDEEEAEEENVSWWDEEDDDE